MVGRRTARSIARMTGVACAAVLLCVACGARGPLDAPDYFFANADGGDEGSTSEGGGGGADAAGIVDGSKKADASVDAANPINCAICVGQSCSNQIIACVTSQSCLGTLNCVFSKCLTGGSVNPVCAFGCAGEAGPQGLLEVLAVFQCITMSCGADCNSLIGGLGGGLGGGKMAAPHDTPSMNGSMNGPMDARATRRAARDAFASFPEMCHAIPEDPAATNQ